MRNIFLLSNAAFACPFCEWGSYDAAYFIVAFLGLFILSGTIIFLAFLKSGGMEKSKQNSLRVLDAEGIKYER